MNRAPKNTLEAFMWARDNGADGLELDVRRTRDAELVVIHDSTVKRTTDSLDSVRVSDPLQELKGLDAGAWFDPDFAGARIPSLYDVFETFFDTALLYILDVKEVELVPQLVELVE